MIEIIPTIVPASSADISEWGEKFARVAPWVQIDIGDGVFVSNKPWSPPETYRLPQFDSVSYEAHLMVQAPQEVGTQFIRAGCRRVIGHLEVFSTPDESRSVLHAWKGQGAEVGLALLIDTPLEAVEPLVSACDVVLLMAIATLGRQGAAFDERIYARVRELRAKHPDLTIAIDGGVSPQNIRALVEAGASRFSVGSAISRSPDPAAAYPDPM